MALSSIGGLGAVALNNIDELADYSGQPINRMLQRKDKERDERQEQYELLIKRQEANAKTRNARTLAATENRTALSEADIRKMHTNAPKLTAPIASKKRIPQYTEIMNYYQNYGSEEAAEYADILRKQYMVEYDLAPPETVSAEGQQKAADLDKTTSQTNLNQARQAESQAVTEAWSRGGVPRNTARAATVPEMAVIAASIEEQGKEGAAWYKRWIGTMSQNEKLIAIGKVIQYKNYMASKNMPITDTQAAKDVESGVADAAMSGQSTYPPNPNQQPNTSLPPRSSGQEGEFSDPLNIMGIVTE